MKGLTTEHSEVPRNSTESTSEASDNASTQNRGSQSSAAIGMAPQLLQPLSMSSSSDSTPVHAPVMRTNAATGWSVRLVADDADARAMQSTEIVRVALEVDGVLSIRFGLDEPDDTSSPQTVTIDLSSPSAADAEERAQGLVYRMRRAARLRDAVMPIVWVAPFDEHGPDDGFLSQAEEFQESNPELAVVAAQIHLESQVRLMLLRAAQASVGDELAEILVAQRGFANLNNQATRKMVRKLIGVDVTAVPADWQQFRAHSARRNAIVHRGTRVTPAQAKDSIAAVRSIWRRMTDISDGG